ncbi:MBL fold metallo-hydrolase [Ponticoccus sp. SC2-23]|uniref:MBL fold metallo-hydrolase n=1 Tax=Alexandriicola marinus TaxID=2081710 RepID=UPI000FDA1935|nr:MBL fold metallo-hydrolase [Alexandriicola marinus]MBM1218750.1 MBL fold metallo-hydrolase [Ponticoccus sp. SC6-9]MBM1224178.1 MBL fold metallo-hydrolase [Ponticoccus sp. SC6-15]MBM1230043.1 MBL fold metallo-hydrolase [Ponticoccus sp. SC6-38]MBM1233144.1 MBL fold metallo-hydrolase [Ponticoccus sp. SC6-45]MBM1236906.1 MBL fold metallo-hydrolase [Ponticoccus sp. SC6-49]MBM1242155.1 MBL fold metallo-hydrolase [Ponticoccus sp. SC2-64]MBM1246668.1 MBL fold metallo-hydrolase [Ponticoccus sp. SC
MIRAKPQDWYRIRHLSDDVTFIDEPFIHEFYRCNIWHVRGRDRDMLVDSGMGVVSLRDWVPLVTERALTAVASHTHFDHIGCHHEFEDRAVHRAEAGIMADPTRASTLADPYVTDEIFDRLPPAPYESATYAVKRAPATRILDDGDLVDLGDRQFEVIHTPGHSPGGIALWEAATGILFSGDIVYDGPLIEDTYHADAADYHRSMVRLHDLPVRVVHGGHFPSYDGARHRQIIRAWLDEKERG